jgi:hypothetical protein
MERPKSPTEERKIISKGAASTFSNGFGSQTERFRESPFIITQENPGPGHYEKEKEVHEVDIVATPLLQ